MREVISNKWAKFKENNVATKEENEKFFFESGGANEAFATGFAALMANSYVQEATKSGVSTIDYLQTNLSSVIERFSDAFTVNPAGAAVGIVWIGGLTAVFGAMAIGATKANIKRNSLMNEWSKKLADSKIVFKEGANFTASTYPKFNFLMAKANAAFAGAAFAASTYTDEQSASRLLIAGAAVTAINSVRECLKGKENFNKLQTLALG
ncbi:MAG: hypothetical protein AAF244_03590 [Pseudomonadota bacterium]